MSASDGHALLTIALLARPGAARERLREALDHAGARVVFEDDPTTLELQALRDADPGAVLIALEPAIEDALERLDPVLASPSLTLIFDEAELAARRDGWEAQRWARHLVAKLHGHQDVLPPGSEQDQQLQPEPGLPTTPAELHADAPLEFHLREAADAAPEVPSDGLYQAPQDLSEPVSLEEALAALQPLPDASGMPGIPVPVPAADIAASVAPIAAIGDHSRWSLVELEPDSGIEGGCPGAVLVLAGIGGPDALRRLLAALPESLSTAILVHMRLDGGRYGNLVKQMARVSALPVVLAEVAQPVDAGQVYILPDDVGVVAGQGGLQFIADTAGIQIDALPAAHSGVVLLSGADAAQLDAVLALAASGAWVAGQVGEGCYDPTAASAVVVAGQDAGEPPQLAATIAQRWGVDA
ncbi:chemotaxis protein CheB [Stenotrophomonas sp. TWI587]|uniref:chemotaxis protein CheB n=1 Tax=Stenotrophomonas sp. TWI587 TaxID=3136783 RepID=UPI00320AD3C5